MNKAAILLTGLAFAGTAAYLVLRNGIRISVAGFDKASGLLTLSIDGELTQVTKAQYAAEGGIGISHGKFHITIAQDQGGIAKTIFIRTYKGYSEVLATLTVAP